MLCQAVTRDRVHLSGLALASGEWERVYEDDDDDDDEGEEEEERRLRRNGVGDVASSKPPPRPWDKSAKYEKGDVVSVRSRRQDGSERISVYRAGTSFPLSRPGDVFNRACYDLFSKEVGQPSSSYGVSTVCNLHLVHTIFVVVCCLGLYAASEKIVQVGTMAVAANIVAGYAMSKGGVVDYEKYGKWAEEMVRREDGMY